MVSGHKYDSAVIATVAENPKEAISRKYEDQYGNFSCGLWNPKRGQLWIAPEATQIHRIVIWIETRTGNIIGHHAPTNSCTIQVGIILDLFGTSIRYPKQDVYKISNILKTFNSSEMNTSSWIGPFHIEESERRRFSLNMDLLQEKQNCEEWNS